MHKKECERLFLNENQTNKMNNSNHIFQKIENIACKCVSETMDCSVMEDCIYSGHTKTTLAVSVARQLAFLFMHDHYGFSYRRIAERSQMTVNAVMKCVGKARRYRFTDPIYNRVYDMINNKL